MAFSDVSFTLHSVWSFNHTFERLFHNPQGGDVIVLLDSSGSMQKCQKEMKLVVSALKCMTNTMGVWHLPPASGATALVDTVNALMKKTGEGGMGRVDRIIVVTDGEDTASAATQVIGDFLTDGKPGWVQLPPWRYEESASRVDVAAQRERRREAIALHLDKIGVEAAIIGVGEEVKHFISACAKEGSGLKTAHIEIGASPDDVGAIVSTVSAPRRSCPKTVTAANATSINKGDAAALRAEAWRTASHGERRSMPHLVKDGPAFTNETQARYVMYVLRKETAKAGEAGGINNVLFDAVLCIVRWFFALAQSKGTAVAGDLICGRLYPKDRYDRRNGAVFEPPTPDIKPSQWTNLIGRCLELLSRDPDKIVHRVDGLGEQFAEEIRQDKVGALFVESGMPHTHMALTSEDLPQLDGRVLYYKFKADTYLHFEVNPRACGILAWFSDNSGDILAKLEDTVGKLSVVWRGNSGAKSYGGPNLSGEPAARDASVGAPDVASLKRKIAELDAEKAVILDKLAKVSGA